MGMEMLGAMGSSLGDPTQLERIALAKGLAGSSAA
jgi:hypothetical protein